jgi:hypothetical protein
MPRRGAFRPKYAKEGKLYDIFCEFCEKPRENCKCLEEKEDEIT